MTKQSTIDSPAPPGALELWLHDEVGPAYDALKADPSRAVSAERVRKRLAAEHKAASLKK